MAASTVARRRAQVPVAAVGLAGLSVVLVVLGLVSYGPTGWSLVLGAAYGAGAVVLVLQLVLVRAPSRPRRSGRPLLVTACVLLLLGWLVSRGHHETAVAAPDRRHTAVVDSPFEVMETVRQVQVLENRWLLRLPMMSICTQGFDYSLRLRWRDDRSVDVTSGRGKVLATIELGEDGSARLLPSDWFAVC